jgi:transketolase
MDERRAIMARRDRDAARQRQREMYERNPEHFRRKARRAYDSNKDEWNRRTKAWREANPEKAAEMGRRWREENREKRRAHYAVQAALRNGTLVRPATCLSEGCDRTPHAHHADYSKPLEVEWLCARHHYKLHREQRGLER